MANINFDTESISIIISSVSAIGVFLYLPYKLGKYKEKVDALSVGISSVIKGQEKITIMLHSFGERIGTLEGFCGIISVREKYIQSHSPLALTKSGVEILKKSGGKRFIDDNKDGMIKAIEEKNPETALDVEMKAYDVIVQYLQTSEARRLKNFAYAQPFDINLVCEICALHLRDIYLEKHSKLKEDLIYVDDDE